MANPDDEPSGQQTVLLPRLLVRQSRYPKLPMSLQLKCMRYVQIWSNRNRGRQAHDESPITNGRSKNLINAISTRSEKAYNPPPNPNNAQPPIELESDNEEPTPQTPKPIKETQETPVLKSYKPYPQRLRKEKMEAQYGKFLDVICVVQINIPLVDVLAVMRTTTNFSKNLKYASRSWKIHLSSRLRYPINGGRQQGSPNFVKTFSTHSRRTMKHSYSNDDTCFSIDVIDEILEEDFDALLDEGNKILYSIEGTPSKMNSLHNLLNS
ncbi:hypothetical protein Tco_0952291 [Tanacetum coccineum]|uniref:Uncharacterized protein n=1 Tax=Tanacetum coccineum TaxID=301880 RepID=A0ABQ5DZD5_9ASTR